MLTDTIKTDNHVAVGGVGSYFGITKLPFNLGDNMKITNWNIGIVWEDGTEQAIGDVPDWVAKRVDEFLDELESEDE